MARAALDRPAFGISPTTVQATATALRLFEDLHGSLSPERVKRAEVARFIDVLERCPGKRPHNERSWSLIRLVEAYEGTNVERLAVKTMKQHVGTLSAMWNRLQNVGEIDEASQNPFARHRFPKVRRAVGGGFTVEQLQAIIDVPLFTKGERAARSKGEALFWVPWLLIWTGARPEEVAQLLVTDLYSDNGTTNWTLTITDEGDHPRKGPRRVKAVKARRTFPVPLFLVELGLIEYRDWLVAGGESALFPALRTKGKRNELFGGLSERWGGYLRENGVLPAGKRPLREFRHVWNTEALRNRVPEEAREYIMGHSSAHRGQNASYGDRETLGAEVHNVTFSQLDFTRVRRWEPPFK